MTSVGLPGGYQPPRWGRTRRALPVLRPPGMLCCPPRGCSATPWGWSAPPGGAGLGGLCPFCLSRGCCALLPPPPAPRMVPIAPRAGPQWGCSALPCPEGCSAPPPEGAGSLRGNFISHPVTPWRGYLSQGVLSSPISLGLSLSWGVSFSPRSGLEGAFAVPRLYPQTEHLSQGCSLQFTGSGPGAEPGRCAAPSPLDVQAGG